MPGTKTTSGLLASSSPASGTTHPPVAHWNGAFVAATILTSNRAAHGCPETTLSQAMPTEDNTSCSPYNPEAVVSFNTRISTQIGFGGVDTDAPK
jgi:hypothetical protein